MINLSRRRLGWFVLAVALSPTSAQGQIASQSFDELRRIPSVGQVAIMTDETGRSPIAPVAVRAEAGAGNQGSEWQRVDALKPGTRIVVTLKTGEQRIGDFRRATTDDVTIAVGREGGQEPVKEETLPKSLIGTVATYDPVKDGIRRGALAGAGGLLALINVYHKSCGTGCESGANAPAMALAVGAFGAGVGSLVGLLADRDAGRSEVLFPPSAASGQSRWVRTSRFFPARPSVRVGTVYSQTAIHSSVVEGNAAAPGFALAVQVSPHISAHVEYTATNGRFYPTPGSVPDNILQNLVPAPASNRTAGRSYGIERGRVSYVFSQLVGVQPPPWGRLRVEFIGGLGVQGKEDFDYYDAYRTTGQGTMSDPSRIERIPGKYYVLNFQIGELGLVLGLDAEVAVVRGLAVVPMLRYNRTGNPEPSISYGIGAHWRF